MTPAQLDILKAAILADPQLSAQPNNPDGNSAIADALNLPAVPAVMGWSTRAPLSGVVDAVNWATFTPADAPDSTVVFTNRLLAIQSKQINLSNILLACGEGKTLDGSKANVRKGLKDAVTALPAGAGGALVTAGGVGGVNVLNALLRPATRAEVLLKALDLNEPPVTGSIQFGFQGDVQYPDVEAARAR